MSNTMSIFFFDTVSKNISNYFSPTTEWRTLLKGLFFFSRPFTKVYEGVKLTVEHVYKDGRRVRVARLARIVASVGQPGLGDQQPAGGARLCLFRLQADAAAAARRVEVHHLGALEPHHRAGRRRVHVHRARQADGAALLHVHLRRPLDIGLSGCTGGRTGTHAQMVKTETE